MGALLLLLLQLVVAWPILGEGSLQSSYTCVITVFESYDFF